jgi:iron-sulfur cluster repair protein YtfE (RIC family)
VKEEKQIVELMFVKCLLNMYIIELCRKIIKEERILFGMLNKELKYLIN